MANLQKYLPLGLSLSSKELRSYLVSTVLTVVAVSVFSLLRELFLPLLLWLYLSLLIMAIFLLGLTIHLYNKLNISAKDLFNSKSEVNSLKEQKNSLLTQIKEPAEILKQNILGMTAVHDAQQKQIKELLAQQKKIAQLLNNDIRSSEERIQFLSSLESHLITPQIIAEKKYILAKLQNYTRFSEILKQSDE